MLRLKAVPAAILIAALGIFNILFMRHSVPYLAVNIILLLASPIGYIYSNSVSYAVIALSWAFLYPVFVHVYHVDSMNAVATIAVFNGLLLVCLAYKSIVKDDDSMRSSRLREKETACAKLKDEISKADELEEAIKAKELAIISLYEITKKMSEGLKFDDIFKVLSAFLKENFMFRKCSLIMLKSEGGKDGQEREYAVWHAKSGAAAPAESAAAERPDFQKLIRMFSEGFRGIYVSRGENPQFFEDLCIKEAAVKTFVAIPILSEKQMVGVLTVDNLSKDDVERLAILAMQFALEIKKVRLYEKVERMAITDSLTGLYVRRHFLELMDEELKRSKRHKFSFAFLMLDIDDFKRCNDMYGHLVGDVVLKEVTRIIKENVREIDIVGRYGGEELSIILPETGIQSAKVVAERLRKKMEEHVFKAYDEKLNITVSAGMSMYPRDSADADELIEKADAALYAAKKSGKNLVCEYKKEYNNHS